MSFNNLYRHYAQHARAASMLMLTITLVVTPLVAARAQAGMTTDSSRAIRLTPPQPAIDDAAKRAEASSRRARVAEAIGATNVLVLFSAEPKVYTGDVDYEYRQENNFYYLTNLRQERAVLVLLPGVGELRELLFLPRRNPAAETWTGRMYSPEEATALSGITEIWSRDEFEPFMRSFAEGKVYRPQTGGVLHSTVRTALPPNTMNAFFAARARGGASLYMLAPPKEQREKSREWVQESRFADAWERDVKSFPIAPAWEIFGEMRLRKSPMEQRLLQHAIDITIEGLGRAMAAASRASWEYEVEAEVEYTFKRRGADFWGYPSIVGCGPNATTLHYWDTRGRVSQGDLLLMDTGAEYDHYTADITRTFPVSGKFTPAQADIYNLVLAAQNAAMAAIKPGETIADVNKAAQDTIRAGLLRLGLITDANSDQYRRWFMHGTSHWLGMNVHDVGGYQSKLEAGMIFTVEPGIYIRPDTLDLLPDTEANRKFIAAVRPAFEKYKNIGVRIEDDVLMTTDGWRNMSAALPRTIPDIERFIERARREMQVAGVQDVERGAIRWFREFALSNFGGFDAAASNANSSDYFFTSSGRTLRRGFIRINSHRNPATVHNHEAE